MQSHCASSLSISSAFVSIRVFSLKFFSLFLSHWISSLEQNCQSGRWRLIYRDDSFEADFWGPELEKIKCKYQDRILPAHHNLTRKIQNITQAILTANDLGYVKSENNLGFCSAVYRLFGRLFQAPATRSLKSDEKPNLKGGVTNREWEVVVIDDPDHINATAFPGEGIIHKRHDGNLNLRNHFLRQYHHLHWPSLGSRGRTSDSSSDRAWWGRLFHP